MKTNKTKVTEASVEAHLAAIPDESRRKDCRDLAALMANTTKEKPTMWGSSIIGFGSRHYKYESGREGDICVVGFASRKSDIVIYGLGAIAAEQPALLSGLGKHRSGKGCLYINALSEIDPKVLQRLVAGAAAGHR